MNTIEGLQQYSADIAKWQRDHFLYSYSRRPTKPVLREDEPPEEYARRVNAYSNAIKRWDGAPNPDDYGIVLYQKVLIGINQVLKFGTQHVRLFGYRLTTELEEFELHLIKHGFKYDYIEKVDGSVEIDIDKDYLFLFSKESATFSLAIVSSDGVHVTGFYFYNDKGYKDERQRVNTIADIHDYLMSDKRITTKKIKSEKGCHNFIQDYIAPYEAVRVTDNNIYITTTEEYKKLPKYRLSSIKSEWIAYLLIAIIYLLPAVYGLYSNSERNNLTTAPLYKENTDDKIKVLICTGSSSTSYHIDPDCYGLQNCSEQISQISLSEAIRKGRKPCGFCCD